MAASEFNRNNQNWLFGGVNFHIPGDGGPNCTNYTTMSRRYMESAFFVTAASVLLVSVYKNCKLPHLRSFQVPQKDKSGGRFLLALAALIFGMQIAFKCASKTAIYLLNPCHITFAIQIYLLAAAPSKLSAGIFRFHLGLMNGGILALAFPVTNTLFLPLETELFFLQHFLIVVIPCYLVHAGGAYSIENLNAVSWACATFSGIVYYHSVFLPIIALPIQVNLSQVLCPAVTDPLSGPNYRIWLVTHQAIFVPFLVKIYIATASSLLRRFQESKTASSEYIRDHACVSGEVTMGMTNNNNSCSNHSLN